MNNFELHSRAHELADNSNAYSLARKLIVAEEELAELRRNHSDNVEPAAYCMISDDWCQLRYHTIKTEAEHDAVRFNGKVEPLYRHPPAPAAVPDCDDLAQFIRTTDGTNTMGAGALAERICDWIAKSEHTGNGEVL